MAPAATQNGAGTSSQWIQLSAGGAAELRAVVEAPGAPCPKFRLGNGDYLTLMPRAPADDKFTLLCSASLPKGARVEGLPVINLSPARIVVLGDTGCRLKDQTIQNCNNPRDWPFPKRRGGGGAAETRSGD